MRRPLVLLALAIGAVVSVPTIALAQTATVEILPAPTGNNVSAGLSVSGDGDTIVGYSGIHPTFTAYRWNDGTFQDLATLPGFSENGSQATGASADGSVVVGTSKGAIDDRAFRWTAAGLQELPTVVDQFGNRGTAAYGVSADGAVVVGVSRVFSGDRNACFWKSGAIQSLGTIGNAGGGSEAHAASADGSVIVGWTATPTVFFGRAFRWKDGVIQDLGSLDGTTGQSRAEGVSGDGEIVVGYSDGAPGAPERAFRWTSAGMVELPSVIPNSPFNRAYDVSDDGRIIVGQSTNGAGSGGGACIWIDGQVRTLYDLLANEYGVDLAGPGWAYFVSIDSCSADGTVLTGTAGHRLGTPQVQKQVAFRVTLPRLNVAPTVTSTVTEGSTQIAAADSTFLRTFNGSDADAGEELTLEVTGLPPGAFMTPSAGTKGPGTPAAPFLATFEWTPSASDVGSSYPVTVTFRDSFGVPVSRNFTISVRSNVTPTVAGLDPVTLECVNGKHLVTLETVVADADADPLTVTWKVDGVVKKTQSNVASGSTATFAANYAHGVHSVVVEATDGFAKGTGGTTVTVQDTGDPTIVVAGDAELTTDLGKAYASKARLPLPTVSDGSGHPVTLTSDAPTQFPLGESTVVWTATDGAGHQVTATQRVVVVDEEKPLIVPSAAITAFCDPGKTYAIRTLAPPKVSDNVPGGVTVTTGAGTKFTIGVHRVLWTATDSFGNASQWVQTVTVVNRKPKANAGKDVTVTTTSPRGVRVILNGSASSDPDKQKLKYAWKAKGVSLSPTNGVKPAGTFPVGKTTTATLTVTDAGGLKHSDTVKVTVKLKSRRTGGTDADRSFVAATQEAKKAVAAKGSNSAALSGLAYANAASAYGAAAGEFVRWEEGQSEADALLSYAELRAMQAAYGDAAASALLSAYAETGDQSLLSAYGYAAYGTAYAAADLAER